MQSPENKSVPGEIKTPAPSLVSKKLLAKKLFLGI